MNLPYATTSRGMNILVIGLALIAGIAMAWYVASLNLTTILVDETSHLNIARQTVDSLTPGISQIGYWPPLLHVLMAPFAWFDALYTSGLAGAMVLIPMLALATYFIYKLVVLITGRPVLGVGGALLLVLNPYMLYYASVPMMEVLFLAMLFGVAYYLAVWIRQGGVGNLLLTGIFVSLASLSRFEGIALLPLAGLIVIFILLERKKKFDEINALTIIFTFVGIVGIFFILFYGWIFGNGPLEFLNGSWSAVQQQQEQGLALPAKFDIVQSVNYLLHASYYVIGKPFVFFAFLASVLLLALAPRRDLIAILAVLISPFLVVLISLFRGIAVLYVPELAPFGQYGDFFNERYGLLWIGFLIVAPLFLFGILGARFTMGKWRTLGMVVPVVLLALPIAMELQMLYRVAVVEKFSVVRASSLGYPTGFEAEVAAYVKDNYDYGKILMPRALNNYVAIKSGIPLQNYIHESNYKFFDQAIARPWIFARYVIMVNQNSTQTMVITPWTKQNERISRTWGNSQTFRSYYDLVLENDGELVFKIREDAVRSYAVERGMDIDKVPSLNGHIVTWDPDHIYRDMGAEYLTYAWEPNEPLAQAGDSASSGSGSNLPDEDDIVTAPSSSETPTPTRTPTTTMTPRPTPTLTRTPLPSSAPEEASTPTPIREPARATLFPPRTSPPSPTPTPTPTPSRPLSPSSTPLSTPREPERPQATVSRTPLPSPVRLLPSIPLLNGDEDEDDEERREDEQRERKRAEQNDVKKPDRVFLRAPFVVSRDLLGIW